jgi:hypothetical protein
LRLVAALFIPRLEMTVALAIFECSGDALRVLASIRS